MTQRPSPRKEGMKERCRVFSSHLWVRRISEGENRNTVIRLTATPLPSTSPISGPIWNRIRHRARKPMTVVSPLERMDMVDLHRADTMASWGLAESRRHSSKRCRRKME